VEISPAADISINSKDGITKYPAPTSLNLLNSVDVFVGCSSVCSYGGNTYVGVQHYSGGIVRIGEDFTLTKLVTNNDSVRAVTLYKDKLYALSSYNSQEFWQVGIYSLDGNQVTSWTHRDENWSRNQLVIIDDQVVSPDRNRNSITVYSLTGEVIKHIPCSLTNKNHTWSICAADRHCVVVSDSSQVSKLDLTTEKVIWTCKDVPKPQALTRYRSNYILVTDESRNTSVWVLDVKTGQ